MAERPETPVQSRTPEELAILPKPHLVTGHHFTERDEANSAFTRFDSGDLTVHTWDKSVLHKLAASNPQASVFSIDGMISGRPGNQNKRDYDAGQKRSLWLGLPGTPKEINSSGEVYVVTGDVIDSDYRDIFEKFYSERISDPDSRKRGLAVITEKRPELQSTSTEEWPDFYAWLSSVGAAAIALTAAVQYGDKKAAEAGRAPRDAKTYARRSFLKLAVVGGGNDCCGICGGTFWPSVKGTQDYG